MSEILGEARILIRPDTTTFRAQLESQIALATRTPVVVPVTATPGAVGGAGLAKAKADQEALAGAIAVSAQAEKQATKAAADHARQLGQLASGARSATLAQLGLRGATLAAGGAFLAGAVSIKLASLAIAAASDHTEQLNKSVEVFAGSADQVKQWSTTTATSMGISETAALKAASTFGELFRTLHIGPAEAASLSESLVKLASDLASFNNVGTDRALNALQSGLVGQARPLRNLGVFLTEARVKQEAFAETGKRSATELTQQDKILARYNLIMQDATIASGDFARTQDRLANQSRILQAQLDNLAVELGGPLTKVLTHVIQDTNILLTGLTKLAKVDPIEIPVKFVFNAGGGGGVSGAIGTALRTAFLQVTPIGQEINIFKGLDFILQKIGHSSSDAGNALTGFARDAGDATKVQDALFAATERSSSAFNDLQQASTRASDALLKIQSEGGGPSAQLPAAQQQLASDQAILAQLLASPEAKGRATAIRKIRQRIVQDRAEIKSLQGEITSAANQDAQDAKDAATKAQQARDAADQALLSSFTSQQTKITDALINAGPKRAIALTIKLRDLYRKQRDEARKQIKDLQTRKETLAADTTEIITLNKQIHDLQKQQADALAQQIQDAQDAKQTHLEALLSIAETTTGTRDDVKALNAIIAFDRKRIDALKRKKKLTQEEKAELDALRVDMAQRNEALRNLIGEQKKNNTATAEFAFLQTQTGFVSNLLGNLIPGGSTAGLVGGSTPSPGLRQVPGGFEQPRGSLESAAMASKAGTTAGPTLGQAETTNSILRRILAELHRLNTGNDHPEATKQRRTGAAIMDFQSASPGF